MYEYLLTIAYMVTDDREGRASCTVHFLDSVGTYSTQHMLQRVGVYVVIRCICFEQY